ncbi:aldo/keto reductase [Leptolyngbya sp. FACHB-711]|uniref:aldo/keto reductase n=1 Tax=unclassified Leptolyngbya TaxID=2650499 RepID=UPI001684E65F|nr:aldo/keto reductase [Leptolyngbya sp. FACHB-711]MBD1853683.1 aldo/keto reductase [Cyanobacteria bacterium FACHB-502]MBD2028065.1 aldo/keto reductase [Leptolyngbya sp. FACHB-711]
MDILSIGSSGLTIKPLGIGTWQWGDNLFWTYGKDYDASSVEQAFKTALESGVNFFDTAEIYGLGKSETLLGQFMQQTNQPVYIATKYFPLPWRFGKSAVADALTASLKRLQRDTVELYQVHQPFDFFMGQPTLMEALADEVKRGRIKAIGVSNYSADQMRQAHELLAKRGVPLAVNQMQYSLLARQIEHNGVMAAAKELGIMILAYSPLAQGLLTGKYTPENYQDPTGARKLDPRFSRGGVEKLAPVIMLLKQIGEKYDRTPAQVSLNWLIAQGNVVPIPGAKNGSQAQQNAGALGWSLTQEEIDRIDQATRPHQQRFL